MELKVIENEKGVFKIEVAGESHTLLNILRENCWASGANQAAYIMDHPYLSEPKLTVRAENPKKVMDTAAELTEKQVAEFLREFRKVKKS